MPIIIYKYYIIMSCLCLYSLLQIYYIYLYKYNSGFGVNNVMALYLLPVYIYNILYIPYIIAFDSRIRLGGGRRHWKP